MPIVDIDSLAIRFRLPRVFVGMLHAIASKTLVILEDNVDGSEATETVPFGLDGMSYEIDLSTENAAKLRAALAPYVKAVEARPTGDREASTPVTRNPRRRTTKPVDSLPSVPGPQATGSRWARVAASPPTSFISITKPVTDRPTVSRPSPRNMWRHAQNVDLSMLPASASIPGPKVSAVPPPVPFESGTVNAGRPSRDSPPSLPPRAGSSPPSPVNRPLSRAAIPDQRARQAANGRTLAPFVRGRYCVVSRRRRTSRSRCVEPGHQGRVPGSARPVGRVASPARSDPRSVHRGSLRARL